MKKSIILLIGIIVSITASAQNVMRVELNDGTVAKYPTADVKQITFEEDMPVGTPVDLGLPSGTLWADFNVGASKPSEPGNYYGWGETETHTLYSWENYTLYDYDNEVWIKWEGDSLDFGNTDIDVAHVKWGGQWRTPSCAQYKELAEYCTWTLTEEDGMRGYKVTGKNGNSIFIPFNGVITDHIQSVGVIGNYWSSSRYKDPEYLGYALFIAPGEDMEDSLDPDACAYRYYGYGIRPVIGNYMETKKFEAVDMALPSGTKWANMNIGATSPEKAGNIYAWAEVEVKDTYSKENYSFYDAATQTFEPVGEQRESIYYNVAEEMNDTVNVYDIQGSGYDMAAHELGENWTTPTLEQYGELMQYCTWTWTTQNGVNGYLVTASNNNSIFLPAAGIYEHNIGAACGAWWAGHVNRCGAPNGYLVVTVKGDDVKWRYKATGRPADYQFRVYKPGEFETQKQYVVANIWDWDIAYTVNWYEDGVLKGAMQQFEDEDQAYIQQNKGKRSGYKTRHLFRAKPSPNAKTVTVEVTNRFGETFTQTIKL